MPESNIFVGEPLTLECDKCKGQSFDRITAGGAPADRDDAGVTIWPDRDRYEEDNSLGTRGGYTETRVRCSGCGQEYHIVSANHKGTEKIGLIEVFE